MANASTVAENQSLSGLTGTLTGGTNVVNYLALHTGATGTTGTNENPSTGGYARQSTAWNTPSGGSMTNSSSATFATAGTTPVTNFGTDSAASAGTFGIGGALASSITAASITLAAGAVSLGSA